MNRLEVKDLLYKQQDKDYKEFNNKIIPGVEKSIGIRMGALREISKNLAKNNYNEYFKELDKTSLKDLFYEEIMLQGLTIGIIKVSPEERLMYIKAFIPKITNWAICDSFVSGLKFTKKNKELVWEFINPYFKDQREFYLRFAVVMLMDYFIDDQHIETNLNILEKIKNEGYYVKMGVAWAISVCYVKYPEVTRTFLEREDNQLDDFTYNKAIQKIRESYRVSKEEKEYLNTLKRKKSRE